MCEDDIGDFTCAVGFKESNGTCVPDSNICKNLRKSTRVTKIDSSISFLLNTELEVTSTVPDAADYQISLKSKTAPTPLRARTTVTLNQTGEFDLFIENSDRSETCFVTGLKGHKWVQCDKQAGKDKRGQLHNTADTGFGAVECSECRAQEGKLRSSRQFCLSECDH